MLIRARNCADAVLLQAAADGNIEVLKQHQQSNLQITWNTTCTSGCTALHWAAGMNQVHVIRYLLNLCQCEDPLISESIDKAAKNIISTLAFHVDLPVAKKYKAAGRTPMHYAARNGAIEAMKCLIEEFRANPNAQAKHGVTPLHLAFFQNQKHVAEYLLRPENQIDLFQTNDYGCNVLHWLAICPASRAGPDGGMHLIQTAQWLNEVQQEKLLRCHHNKSSKPINLFHARQTQGHTVLHKAAWLGHYALIRYLHECHGLWDDSPDHSGNYAVTLAEMARHDDEDATVNYLRMFCSRSAAYSCSILGLSIKDINNPLRIRRAYLAMALEYHPDRQMKMEQKDTRKNSINDKKLENHTCQNENIMLTFDDIYKAYHHLLHEEGRGLECNDAHKLRILLPASENVTGSIAIDDDCFKTRLLIVLREYGSKGLDLSNLKKKWKQVWQTNFPKNNDDAPLTRWIQDRAGDVVEIRAVNQCHRAYPKLQQ